jgi:hypothetical protein
MDDEVLLIMGFYDRKNIGDECYKLAFPLLFPNVKKITFECTDDIEKIPDDVTTVVCGGGDIVNEYFMKKTQDLLKDFMGRTYAVSVGIPYDDATVKYLHMFDHVFVRSTADYQIAAREIGEYNVSYFPDISVLLKPSRIPLPSTSLAHHPRIGLCLAQPYFHNNPNKHDLLVSIANTLQNVYNYYSGNIVIHFLNFNINTASLEECDKVCAAEMVAFLETNGIPYVTHDDITEPAMMIDFINTSIDVMLCMRYHSVMFSVITNTRFVPVFVSQKIDNLLQDLNYDSQRAYKIPTDDLYKPISIDEDRLYKCLVFACRSRKNNNELTDITSISLQCITKMMFSEKKLARMMVTETFNSFEDAPLVCIRGLCKYLHIDSAIYENLLMSQKGPLPIGDKSPLDVARFICFLISGKIHHPCVWGLAAKITTHDFDLYESIKYIWEFCKVQHDIVEKQHTYYPPLANRLTRNVLINLDFVFSNDFAQYHRSGWSYVIGGLMNLDASRLLKRSDIMLDTYVDRSFHWGYDILKHIGMIPYTKPWHGFIHHTFDITHSEYNCHNLFANQDFLDSLATCRGLFALSDYLAQQIRDALAALQLNIPVYTLYHPTEFVDNVFTMSKFMNNPQKKVVQIGAWLRNPYSIYALPLPPTTSFTKVALKGKEMDLYFPPEDFMQTLQDVFLKDADADADANKDPTTICRNNAICRHNGATNKFYKGLYEHIVAEFNTVKVLEKLSNEEYDNLLSENIVFLNLVDCSAVNTLLECIARNTPVLVNRAPAIEEILGPQYPGFYSSLNEAADICQDLVRIDLIYRHLTKLDKERYKLEHFLDRLQNIIIGRPTAVTNYRLLKPKPYNILEHTRFHHLKSCLPPRMF